MILNNLKLDWFEVHSIGTREAARIALRRERSDPACLVDVNRRQVACCGSHAGQGPQAPAATSPEHFSQSTEIRGPVSELLEMVRSRGYCLRRRKYLNLLDISSRALALLYEHFVVGGQVGARRKRTIVALWLTRNSLT
jgi:hypothetical protein